LQSAASVDTVLIAAAQNLAEALNASRVAIRVTAGADTPGEPEFNQGGTP
jgi:hypothetical protein